MLIPTVILVILATIAAAKQKYLAIKVKSSLVPHCVVLILFTLRYIKLCQQLTGIHTHTHTHLYIYIYTSVCTTHPAYFQMLPRGVSSAIFHFHFHFHCPKLS